jgi:hypothetical protein
VSGRVRGRRVREDEGNATGHITLAQVDAIEDLFVSNHYTTLHDSYEQQQVTDMPSALALTGHSTVT